MKLKLTLIFLLFIYNLTLSQSLDLQFLKNCTSYSEYELSDKLNEIGFSLLNNNFEDSFCNKSYIKGKYFTNNPKRSGGGEIGFIVHKNNTEVIIEIDYSSDFEDFERIGTNIDKFFKLEKTFYSSKYKCTVKKYSYNNYFYYAYIDQQIKDLNFPGFLISNVRIDECYFSN